VGGRGGATIVICTYPFWLKKTRDPRASTWFLERASLGLALLPAPPMAPPAAVVEGVRQVWWDLLPATSGFLDAAYLSVRIQQWQQQLTTQRHRAGNAVPTPDRLRSELQEVFVPVMQEFYAEARRRGEHVSPRMYTEVWRQTMLWVTTGTASAIRYAEFITAPEVATLLGHVAPHGEARTIAQLIVASQAPGLGGDTGAIPEIDRQPQMAVGGPAPTMDMTDDDDEAVVIDDDSETSRPAAPRGSRPAIRHKPGTMTEPDTIEEWSSGFFAHLVGVLVGPAVILPLLAGGVIQSFYGSTRTTMATLSALIIASWRVSVRSAASVGCFFGSFHVIGFRGVLVDGSLVGCGHRRSSVGRTYC